MKTKIESNEYSNIMEYRDDLILMCENCMTYNKQDTIYYQFAKKMLDYGFKLLSREKLLDLRGRVRCMRHLASEELGFSLDSSELYYDANAIRKKQSENKLAAFKIDPLALTHQVARHSWLVAPEGQPDPEGESAAERARREESAKEILDKVRALAQVAAAKLAKKNPRGKVWDSGFLGGSDGRGQLKKRLVTFTELGFGSGPRNQRSIRVLFIC